jgi:hypothetical protein
LKTNCTSFAARLSSCFSRDKLRDFRNFLHSSRQQFSRCERTFQFIAVLRSILKYARPHYDNYRARFCVGHNPADGNLRFVLYTKNSWNKRVGNRRDKRGTHLVFFKLVNGFYSIMITTERVEFNPI